jgi:acid stress chaperone HdeB
MVHYKRGLLGIVLVPFLIPSAHAQVTIDVSKITCEQFILYQITNADNIAIWLHGYHSAKRGTTVVDVQTFKENAGKLKEYCRMNFKEMVMQAVEKVLGTGK